jgi:hypothetical protein
MVANLTLKRANKGYQQLWIPIRSKNLMGNCLTEFSAVWAYNPQYKTG